MIDKIKTILFTVMVTAVFTFLVSGVNSALSARIAANKLISKQKVILSLFGLASETEKISEGEIPGFFGRKVTADNSLKSLNVESYRLLAGNPDLQVFSFAGQGFWDTIKGYIAVDRKKKLIKGIEFTQHGETPGLGGRISEREFKARFVDKPFGKVRSDGLRLKFVPEGSAVKTDEIDGITGATGTSTALEKIVNNILNEISKSFTGGNEK
ncbi:MAG: Na(+)-translocating NADH-quinone reductase subunit C [Candidatus Rifleibacteriota bacterium]